ncbi:hypothetical protein [Burkholderia sp. LMG 32019]|uniref:hypothetical protein n=1 Tax=Burkholderia sp. LMG 32019 TaxID=3158173 RepID=UPI003C2F0475
MLPTKEELKKRIADHVNNYPDLESMVAAGRLTYKSGWYEAADPAAYEAVSRYITALRSGKNGKVQFKLARKSKALQALVGKTQAE